MDTDLLLIFGIPATVIVVLAVLRHRQRMELIRQGVRPEPELPRYPGRGPLLWGILLTGIGIVSFLYTLTNPHEDMKLGLLSLGAGPALLLYWKLTASDRERQVRFYEEWIAANRTQVSKSPSVRDPEPDDTGNDA